MYTAPNNVIEISKKRIIGAAFFGAILGSYIDNAFNYTIPGILAMVQEIDLELAQQNYESSIIFNLTTRIVIAFAGASIAAFIARRKGILVGLLANSFYLLFLGGFLTYLIIQGKDIFMGNISLQLHTFLQFLLMIVGSVFGGFTGEKYYSSDKDFDLGKDKLTIFGVRWFHYFWVFPIVFLSFLSAVIIVIYAGIIISLADFYFVIHPSLWLNFAWWFYFFIVPGLVFLAAWITVGAFVRFYGVMQHQQTESKWLKKFGQVLLYGIGAPALSYSIAFIGANITHNMPKPSSGDWKFFLIPILIICVISFISYLVSWLRARSVVLDTNNFDGYSEESTKRERAEIEGCEETGVAEDEDLEKAVAFWEGKVAEREKLVADLSIETQELKIKLSIFEGEYNARIGILYVKLDKITLSIKEYKHRIKLVKQGKLSTDKLEDIEDDVKDTFYDEREKINDLEEETFESSQEYEHHREEEEVQLDEEHEQELKRLYRKLAKKYHPDKAIDKKQREDYHKIMAEINEAYRAKNIDKLRSYAERMDKEEKIAKETSKEKLDRLKHEEEVLSGIIRKLEEEMKSLNLSETYLMMEKVQLAREKGEDPLEQLAIDLKGQISKNQDNLESLIAEYKTLLKDLS